VLRAAAASSAPAAAVDAAADADAPVDGGAASGVDSSCPDNDIATDSFSPDAVESVAETPLPAAAELCCLPTADRLLLISHHPSLSITKEAKPLNSAAPDESLVGKCNFELQNSTPNLALALRSGPSGATV